MIIGRLCARLKVNPKYILYRLHTSYYSKFTGFLPNDISDDNEIQYPSQIVYDFDRIAALNKELNITDIDYKEVGEVEDAPKMLSIKEKMKIVLEKKAKKIKNQR